MQQNTHLTNLVETIRWMNAKGWSPATSTNYSLRHAENPLLMHISKSGVDKQFFSESDFMLCDFEGLATPEFAAIKPSAETLIHCWLYKKLPETNCILHSHSVYATVLSRKINSGDLCLNGLEVQKALPGINSHLEELMIPVFDNDQDMPRFVKTLDKHFGKKAPEMPAFLMAGHGLYTWGNNLKEAKQHLEAVEFLLECSYKLMLIRK